MAVSQRSRVHGGLPGCRGTCLAHHEPSPPDHGGEAGEIVRLGRRVFGGEWTMSASDSAESFSVKEAFKWFDVRKRDPGMWAFALNRLTALGLVFYLFLHLVVLSTLARGPQAYADFLAWIGSPVFIFGEWMVVIAGLYHGLNGIRIALTSLGIGLPRQAQMFYIALGVAVLAGAAFGIRMFR
jgi:succinate dehydrogenase / fumarate reductase cytochrome b subunit